LLLSISGNIQAFKSSLVGFKPKEYIIFEIPRSADFDSQIAANSSIKGTFISSGVVIRFKAFVLNALEKPARLVFASFPELLDSRELRKSKRKECYIPAVLKLYTNMSQYSGTIVDMSPAGCRFHTDLISMSKSELPIGTNVLLIIQTSSLQRKQILDGKIVNIQGGCPKIFLGIEFTGNHEELKDIDAAGQDMPNG
jgi:hypothetical protein